MADKADKKADAAPAKDAAAGAKDGEAKKAGAGGMLAKTPVLLGIVMLIEAIVLFAGFKFLGGGPKQASAIELKLDEPEHGGKEGHGDGHGGDAPRRSNDKEKLVEVLQNFKAINTQNGRRYIYDLSVSAI